VILLLSHVLKCYFRSEMGQSSTSSTPHSSLWLSLMEDDIVLETNVSNVLGGRPAAADSKSLLHIRSRSPECFNSCSAAPMGHGKLYACNQHLPLFVFFPPSTIILPPGLSVNATLRLNLTGLKVPGSVCGPLLLIVDVNPLADSDLTNNRVEYPFFVDCQQSQGEDYCLYTTSTVQDSYASRTKANETGETTLYETYDEYCTLVARRSL
jgi:hypothetical protein